MKRSTLTMILLILIVVLAIMLVYNMSSPLAMYPGEAKQQLKEGKFDAVIDVRTDAEWNMGHYPLAIHIPVKDISIALPQRVPDKKSNILIYCNTSTRARIAAEKAQQMGYSNVHYLIGTHMNIM